MKHDPAQPPPNRRVALVGLVTVVALQAAVAARQWGWRFAVAYFAAACAVLIPVSMYFMRTRARAASAAFWLLGSAFVCPAFASASAALGAALVVPTLADLLSPWVSPERTRAIAVVLFLLAGFVTGALFCWAAWLKFPLRSRAA
jgi:hypothetical protein